MGEIQDQPFQLSFSASLKVDFQGSRVTSDGGLILVRELDERLGFGELIEQHLTDSRGKNTQLPLADLLRQSIISAWLVTKTLTTRRGSPTTRSREAGLISSEKVRDRGAALTSRLQTFDTEMLAEDENFAGLGRLNTGRKRGGWVFGVLARGTNGPFRGSWKHFAVQTRLIIVFGSGQMYVIGRAAGR